jgi:choline dehydrogenase
MVCVAYACTKPVSMASAESWRNIASYLLFKQGMLTSNVAEAGGFLKTDASLSIPDLQFLFGPVYYLNHGFTRPEGHGFTFAPVLLRPKSRGRITLRSADPLALPAIQPNYLASDADLRALIAGVKLSCEMAQTKALSAYRGPAVCEKLSTDEEITDFIRRTSETTYHPVGTCKMGADEMAVTDSQLRVRGLENLRVADASIMPAIVGGNTNAPVIMIAEKAADLIKGANNGGA